MLYAYILKIMKNIDMIIRLQMCNNTPINYDQIYQKKKCFTIVYHETTRTNE